MLLYIWWRGALPPFLSHSPLRSDSLALEESLSQWPSSFKEEMLKRTIWHRPWEEELLKEKGLLTLLNWGEVPWRCTVREYQASEQTVFLISVKSSINGQQLILQFKEPTVMWQSCDRGSSVNSRMSYRFRNKEWVYIKNTLNWFYPNFLHPPPLSPLLHFVPELRRIYWTFLTFVNIRDNYFVHWKYIYLRKLLWWDRKLRPLFLCSSWYTETNRIICEWKSRLSFGGWNRPTFTTVFLQSLFKESLSIKLHLWGDGIRCEMYNFVLQNPRLCNLHPAVCSTLAWTPDQREICLVMIELNVC